MRREMSELISGFDFRPHVSGFQATSTFDNKWGVSIIPERDLATYEVAILRNGKISYESGLTEDVLRFQTVDDVHRTLLRVRNLPAAA